MKKMKPAKIKESKKPTQGSYGIVTFDKHTVTKTVKRYSSDGKKVEASSAREIAFLRQFGGCESVPRLTSVKVNDDTYSITMEHGGINLLALASQIGYNERLHMLPIIFGSVAKTLAMMHAVKIIHCDIKPLNITHSCTNGSTRLIDFGSISVAVENKYENSLGAFVYAAPETFKDKQQWSPASDVWSLGMTMLYWITKDELIYDYAGKSNDFEKIKKFYADVKSDCLILPYKYAVKPKHMDLIEVMLSIDPADRPSIVDVLADLTDLKTPSFMTFKPMVVPVVADETRAKAVVYIYEMIGQHDHLKHLAEHAVRIYDLYVNLYPDESSDTIAHSAIILVSQIYAQVSPSIVGANMAPIMATHARMLTKIGKLLY